MGVPIIGFSNTSLINCNTQYNNMADKKDFQFRVTTKTLLEEGNPVWQDDQDFIKLYNEIQYISLVSPYRCFFLYQFAKSANSLSGQFAQVGVYQGGSAKLIQTVKSKKKNFYLFDTFSGLPKHDPKIDGYPRGKFSDTTIEKIEQLFSEDPTVKIIPGLFPDSSKQITKEKFAFVYIDVDLYKSNYDAFNFFYNRMVPGGIIVFDDYGWRFCRGIKKSIHDFLNKSGAKETPIITTKYQCVLIKS
jgi:hypothetical protein